MPGMILDGETERQLQRCDDSYRQATLQLDLARLEYYQLRTASSTDPNSSICLRRSRNSSGSEALSSELDKLENLS